VRTQGFPPELNVVPFPKQFMERLPVEMSLLD